MENYSAEFDMAEEFFAGYGVTYLQCQDCELVSDKVVYRQGSPTCLPCHILRHPANPSTVSSQECSEVNSQWLDWNGCMSEDSEDEDCSNPRLVIDESATESAVEEDVSAASYASSFCLNDYELGPDMQDVDLDDDIEDCEDSDLPGPVNKFDSLM